MSRRPQRKCAKANKHTNRGNSPTDGTDSIGLVSNQRNDPDWSPSRERPSRRSSSEDSGSSSSASRSPPPKKGKAGSSARRAASSSSSQAVRGVPTGATNGAGLGNPSSILNQGLRSSRLTYPSHSSLTRGQPGNSRTSARTPTPPPTNFAAAGTRMANSGGSMTQQDRRSVSTDGRSRSALRPASLVGSARGSSSSVHHRPLFGNSRSPPRPSVSNALLSQSGIFIGPPSRQQPPYPVNGMQTGVTSQRASQVSGMGSRAAGRPSISSDNAAPARAPQHQASPRQAPPNPAILQTPSDTPNNGDSGSGLEVIPKEEPRQVPVVTRDQESQPQGPHSSNMNVVPVVESLKDLKIVPMRPAFNAPFNRRQRILFVMTNRSDQFIAFRLKFPENGKICSDHPRGIIAPMNHFHNHIKCMPSDMSEETAQAEKFTVTWRNVPQGESEYTDDWFEMDGMIGHKTINVFFHF